MADVSRPLYPGCIEKSSRKYYDLITERLRECLNDSFLLLAYAKDLEDSGFSPAADTIYRFKHGLMNYRAYPPEHWKKIRITNLLELVHKEIKRGTKKFGAFTNDALLMRQAVSILIDINEEWITGNRYLSVKSETILIQVVLILEQYRDTTRSVNSVWILGIYRFGKLLYKNKPIVHEELSKEQFGKYLNMSLNLVENSWIFLNLLSKKPNLIVIASRRKSPSGSLIF